ncbi:MAG: Nickel-dependent hydrogenase large subunit [Parcubacteria group bacterium GW2011_GWC2_39_14]|nr:MAG: Nickel-dependent hydrogenase large subunit [Parcubacteria group bacterium GW2011_GWC2_39_14]KKR54420.1 MAG: Nickel-dependent hydrogenase large subunit [Parcubacteria group bacterium GW2011_GWA2_40_23]
MKTIQINHLGKTEGHMSFVGALVNNDFAEARIETEEGARLIEGILLNRKFYEAPIITARICGICPIVHNLTCIKALEKAENVQVTEEIVVLRKMLINAQFIHSHALHAFFLAFPDIVGISNNFDFVKKYPKECNLALEMRDFAVELSRIIGGRTVHPINSVIGGFNVEPEFSELEKLMLQLPEALKKAQILFNFAAKQKLPEFVRPTNYVCLKDKKEYAIYDGEVLFDDNNKLITPEKFLLDVKELVRPYEKVKRVQHLDRSIMVGALARVNNNFKQLHKVAQESWLKTQKERPCYNSFFNTYAQIVEILHCFKEIEKYFIQYKKLRTKPGFFGRLKVEFKVRAGRGCAVMEAPRGLLYHEYELDNEGKIVYSNIISPTTIFLNNLEDDLKSYLPQIQKLTDKKQVQLIKTLIRAYDPCISCATH